MTVLLLFLAQISQLRTELTEDAADRAEEQALVLAHHAARLFEAAELALTAVTDESREVPWRAIERSRPLFERMRRLAGRLPYVEALWLYGPDGRLHMSSLAFPPPATDVSEREFFIRLRESPGGPAHVDAPLVAASRATVRMSRRLAENGRGFRGVASLTIDLSYFHAFYASLGLPPRSTVTLMRAEDLMPLVSAPGGQGGLHNIGRLRDAILAEPEAGRFQSVSPLDRVERVHAYRQVPGFPLLVTVSIPLDTVRADWRRQVAYRALGATAATGVLGWLTWRGFRQAARQRTFQAQLEARVVERTAALEQANEQLETLVHEVHHRVNNNLQMVGSLLALQTARIIDPRVRAALVQTSGRVHTLSLLHQTMYGAGDMVDIAFGEYLRILAHHLEDILDGQPVHVLVGGENPRLNLDVAVPVALIVHEVLSNVLSHAFPTGRQGTVRIDLNRETDGWELCIVDNGIGLPAGFDWERSSSLGLEIVRRLARQVGGRASFANQPQGTRFALFFPG